MSDTSARGLLDESGDLPGMMDRRQAMARGKVWKPGMPRSFGLDHDGTTRELLAGLESTGFGYADLPDRIDHTDRLRMIARLWGSVRTLQMRFAPVPVGGMVVNRDPEGDGNYFMAYVGERPVF